MARFHAFVTPPWAGVLAAASCLAVLGLGDAAVADPEPEPPQISAAASVAPPYGWIDRRGDYHLRHSELMALGMSADGSLAASGAIDGSVIVWCVADGRALRTIFTGHGNLYAMAFSPDRRTLATTGWDGTISLWSLATGAKLWSTKAEAVQLRFSTDGKRVIGERPSAGDPHGEHRVLDATDGRIVWSGRVHDTSGWPTKIGVIAADGRRSWEVVPVGMHLEGRTSIPSGYVLQAIDLESGKVAREMALAEPEPRALAISQAGDRLAVLGRSITVMSGASGKRLASFTGRRHFAIGLSGDPDRVITWDYADLSAWQVATGTETARVAVYPNASPRPEFGFDDTLVLFDKVGFAAFRLADGVELWRQQGTGFAYATLETRPIAIVKVGPSVFDFVDVRTGKSVLPAPGPAGPAGQILQLAMSADGSRLAGQGGGIWVWDAAASPGTAPVRLVDPPEALGSFTKVTFVAGGRFAVAAWSGLQGSYTVYRYDLDRNAIVETLPVASRRRLHASALAGQQLVVDELDGRQTEHLVVDPSGKVVPRRLHAWRATHGHDDTDWPHESLYHAVVVRDLSRAYVATSDSIHAWDLPTGNLAAHADRQRQRVVLMALSPDGKHLLACDEQGGVILYRAKDLVVEHHLLGLTAPPTAAAFSPDGSYALVGAASGLFVWSTANTALVETVVFTTQREWPSALAFSPDGRTLWVGTSLGLLHRFGLGVLGP